MILNQKSKHLIALTQTIWGEARGEGDVGMKAVACVIRNRVNRPQWWGRTYHAVCHAPWQFSCWNKADPNRTKLLDLETLKNDAAYRRAEQIAWRIMNGIDEDITDGATHYHVASMNPKPRWVDDSEPCKHIGNHLFYNDIR